MNKYKFKKGDILEPIDGFNDRTIKILHQKSSVHGSKTYTYEVLEFHSLNISPVALGHVYNQPAGLIERIYKLTDNSKLKNLIDKI